MTATLPTDDPTAKPLANLYLPVLIAGVRIGFTGASAAILRAARRGKLSLLLSVTLALEYEAVCRQAEHRLASGLSDREVEAFVTAVIAMAEPVKVQFLWRPQLRDADDEMVLETAVNGGADALITFNARHYREVPSRFDIELLLPREAIGRIKLL